MAKELAKHIVNSHTCTDKLPAALKMVYKIEAVALTRDPEF